MTKREFILGIDDAGRGPLIGPMFLAGVLVTKEQDKLLKEAGVKDSKMLTHAVRVKLAETIKENSIKHKVVSSLPDEIDAFVESKSNLNTLEATKTAEIINALNGGKEKIIVVVDCPSVNTAAWRNTLLKFIHHPENLEVVCEHKADVNHPSVSAASILAKVAREDAVGEIRKQFAQYGNIGSGYPSDPATKVFLEKHGKELEDSGIFRKSWQTWKAMFPSSKSQKQATLGEF
ncbi:MAG: ribonuclease HII [archaeon]|jgi:ribonuclease HII|nr:ribonuclease HII [archaeon]